MTDYRLEKFPSEFIHMIKEFEGFRSEPYRCSAGVWTIGYGHTFRSPSPATLNFISSIDFLEAERLLITDLLVHYKDLCSIPNFCLLRSYEQLALLSFVFNLGFTKFKKTQLYQDVLCLLAQMPLCKGDDNLLFRSRAKIVLGFKRFVYANNEILRGLVNRRKKESCLFAVGSYTGNFPSEYLSKLDDAFSTDSGYVQHFDNDLPF